MSFLRSLFSGVSGLRSHQTMMDVIGNNISNINTYGFKASRASFSELYSQTIKGATQSTDTSGGINPVQIGLGTTVGSIDKDFSQGAFETTGVTTDLAITGSGFFIENYNGKTVYSRAGSFSLDSSGKLVNSSTGAVVQGKIADSQGTIPTGTALEDIVIDSNTKSPANATTSISFSGNLNSEAEVGDTVDSSVSVYDSLGNKHTVTLTFTKTSENNWSWAASATSPDSTSSSGTITFNTDGSLNSVSGDTVDLTVSSGAPDVNFTLDFGTESSTTPGVFTGLTQTSSTSSEVSADSQDGYASGSLSSISIDTSGTIVGTFTNGQTLDLGQVMLATFTNVNGLSDLGNGMWDVSGNSGIATIVSPGTTNTISSGSLEQSNVDLSEEFTKMITAQRGFQANARVITTSDEFLQELVALKR